MKTQIKALIPSLLTLANLFFGFAAIASGDPFTGMVLICAGAFIDTFDGMAARALKVVSAFGKELDSLADLVTFGVAPAFLIYRFMLPQGPWSIILASVIPLLSAVRLARFNMDEEQKTVFRGLPTPASGLFFGTLPFLHENIATSLFSTPLLIFTVIVISLMMVIPMPMFSFKGMRAGGKHLVMPLILFAMAIGLIIWLGWAAIPLSVIAYILLSIIFSFGRNTNQP